MSVDSRPPKEALDIADRLPPFRSPARAPPRSDSAPLQERRRKAGTHWRHPRHGMIALFTNHIETRSASAWDRRGRWNVARHPWAAVPSTTTSPQATRGRTSAVCRPPRNPMRAIYIRPDANGRASTSRPGEESALGGVLARLVSHGTPIVLRAEPRRASPPPRLPNQRRTRVARWDASRPKATARPRGCLGHARRCERRTPQSVDDPARARDAEPRATTGSSGIHHTGAWSSTASNTEARRFVYRCAV